MTGRLPAAVALVAVALATGCTMCSAPYDYCGPTFTGHGPCMPDARAGSILSGAGYHAQPVYDEAILWSDAGHAPAAPRIVAHHAAPSAHAASPEQAFAASPQAATARWTPRAMATTRR